MKEEIEPTKEEIDDLLKSAIWVLGMLAFVVCFGVLIGKLVDLWLLPALGMFILAGVLGAILLRREDEGGRV